MFHWSFSISCHFSAKKVYILMWQYLTKNAILILKFESAMRISQSGEARFG